MKKELKNFLHFYLNAGISVFIFPDDSIKDGFLDKYRKDYPNGVYNPILTIENYQRFLNDGYKPILRPVSSMTKEEAQEAGRKFAGYPGEDEDDYTDLVQPFSYTAKHLIDKGFDVFGLINAGLAIDKTLIKEIKEPVTEL